MLQSCDSFKTITSKGKPKQGHRESFGETRKPVSFQNHSIWQMFMGILDPILKKLTYVVQKWQT